MAPGSDLLTPSAAGRSPAPSPGAVVAPAGDPRGATVALARDSICVVACPSGRPMVTNRGQDRDPLTSRCPIRSR